MKNSLKKIIREIIEKVINENSYSDEYYEFRDKVMEKIFDDFKNRKQKQYKRIPWRLIQIDMLKTMWEEFVRNGFVPERFYKNLEKIEDIITINIIKLEILTYLSGHTSEDPSYDFEEYEIKGEKNDNIYVEIRIIGSPNQLTMFEYPAYQFDVVAKKADEHDLSETNEDVESVKLKDVKSLNDTLNEWALNYKILDIKSENNFFDKFKNKYIEKSNEQFHSIEDFHDWTVDADGNDIMSDYGLSPLLKYLRELKEKSKTPEEKIVVIDKMLNVVHQRSDLASWFVKGGSQALSQLSGMSEPEIHRPL